MIERVYSAVDAYPHCGELVEYIGTLLQPELMTYTAKSQTPFPNGRVLIDSSRQGKSIAVVEHDDTTGVRTVDFHTGQPGQGENDSYVSLRLGPSIDGSSGFSTVWNKCKWQAPHFEGGMNIENVTLQPGQFARYGAIWSATEEMPKSTLTYRGRNSKWESERAAEEALAILRTGSFRALGPDQSTEMLSLLSALPMNQKLFWKMAQGSERRDQSHETGQKSVDRRSAGVFTRLLGRLSSRH